MEFSGVFNQTLILLAFLLGLCTGSFLNVVVRRTPEGEKLGGRSHCESCQKGLSALELIPVLSFVLQKRRCRSCDAKLSWQYPVVELSTALLFGFFTWFFLNTNYLTAQSAIWLIILWIGIAASVAIIATDLRSKIIPDRAVIILLGIGMAWSVKRAYDAWSFYQNFGRGLLYDIVVAAVIAALLACLWFFSKGKWMGLGDAKLIFPTSLMLGYPASILGFLFAFWLGGVVGIILILTGRKSLQSQMPFGPFIIMGGAAAYFLAPLITASLYF